MGNDKEGEDMVIEERGKNKLIFSAKFTCRGSTTD